MANEVIINLTAVDMATAIFARVKASVEAFRGTMSGLTASVEASNNSALASIQATSAKIAAEVEKTKSRIASSSQSVVAKTSAFDDIEKANKKALDSIEKLLDKSSVEMDRSNVRMTASYQGAADNVSAIVVNTNKKIASIRQQATSDEIAEVNSSREKINTISANALDKAAQLERTGAERVAAIRRLAINAASNATTSTSSDKILETAAIKMDIITEQARKRSVDAIQTGLKQEEMETQASVRRIATIRENATNAITAQVVGGNEKITANLKDVSAKVAADTSKTTASVMQNIASVSTNALAEIEKSNARITTIFTKDTTQLGNALEKKMQSVTVTGSVDPVQVRANAAKDALDKEERLTRAYVAQQKALQDVDSAQTSATSSLGGFIARHAEIVAFYAALALIGKGFHLLIGDGIEFNKTMETTRMGMAGLILTTHEFSSASGRVVTDGDRIGASFQMAEGIQKRLLVASRNSMATYAELLEMMQTAMGPAIAAGVTNMNTLTTITAGAAIAIKSLGLNSMQLKQELRAIFTGESRPSNLLNMALGITSAQIKALHGDSVAIAEFYKTKFAAFMLIAAQSTGIFAIALTRLKSVWSETAGAFTKPLYTEIGKAMNDAQKQISASLPDASKSGESLAIVFSQVIPLLTSFITLFAVVLKQIVDFLALTTNTSFGVAMINTITSFISKYGEAFLVVVALHKGIVVLIAVIEGVTAASAAAVGPMAMMAAAMGMAVIQAALLAAAIYAVINAWKLIPMGIDYIKSMNEEDNANTRMWIATKDAMDRVSAKYPEIADQVDKLRKKWDEAKTTEGWQAVNDELLQLIRETDGAAERTDILGKAVQNATADMVKNYAKVTEQIDDMSRKMFLAARLSGMTGLNKEVQRINDRVAEERRQIDARLAELQKSQAAAPKDSLEQHQYQEEIDAVEDYRRNSAIAGLNDIAEAQKKYGDKATADAKRRTEELLKFEKDIGTYGVERLIADAQFKYDEAAVKIKEFYGETKEGMYWLAKAATQYANDVFKAWGIFGGGYSDALKRPSGPWLTQEVSGFKKQTWDEFFPGGASGIQNEVSKVADKTADTFSKTWKGIEDGLSAAILGALTGDMKALRTAATRLAETLLSAFTDSFLEPLKEELMGILNLRRDDKGRIVSAGGEGSNLGNTVMAYGGAATAGYGVGSAVGQIGNGQYNQTGAQVGSVIGAVGMTAYEFATFGSVAGPAGMLVGAIIGAVVGLIVGAIFSPNTESHVTGLVSTEMGKKGSQVSKTIDGLYSSLVDVFVAGAPGQAIELVQAYSTALGEAFSATRFDIAAGSQEDIQKTWDWMMSSLLPKMALQAGFGQIGYGLPGGNRDATGGRAGFDWTTGGMDRDGNWIKQQLYDANAPIPLMLAGLGFTARKIQALAVELSNTDDPSAYLKKLEGLVTVVVGFNDLTKKLKGGIDTAFMEIDKSTSQKLEEQRNILITGFKNLSLYSGDEQITKAKELISATDEYYQNSLQYIQQLGSLMDGLLDSIDKQIKGFQDSMKSPSEIMNDARGRATEALGKALTAGPSDVQKWATIAQDAIGVVVDGLMNLHGALLNLKASFEGQIEKMTTWDRGFTATMDDARVRANAYVNAAGQGDAETVAKNGQLALEAVNEIFDGLKSIISAANSAMAEIGKQVTAMRTWDRSFSDSMSAAQSEFATAAEKLRGATGLTPEEIAAFSSDAIDAAQKLFDGLKSIVTAGRTAIDNIKKQIDDMKGWDKNPAESLVSARADFVAAAGTIRDNQGRLSPEEIAKFSNDAIDAAKKIFDALKATITAARNAMISIDAEVKDMTRWDQDFVQSLATARSDFATAAKSLSGQGLSAEDISRFSGDALDATKRIFEALKSIITAARSSIASINAQVDGMKGWDKNPAQILSSAQIDFGKAMTGLGGNNLTPDQINKFSSDAISAAQKIFEGLKAIVTAARTAMESISTQVDAMETWNQSFTKSLDSARSDFADAGEALAVGGLSAEEITKFSGDALDASKRIFDALKAIVTSARTAMASVDAEIKLLMTWDQTFSESLASAQSDYANATKSLAGQNLTPEDITKFSSDAIDATKRIFEALKSIVTTARAALTNINAQAKEMITWDQGFSDSMVAARTDFSTAMTGLAGESLTPEQITKFSTDAMDAARKIFEGLKAVITASRTEIAAIDAQIESIKGYGKSGPEKMDAARTAVSAGQAFFASVTKDTDPAEITKWGNATRGATQILIDGFQAIAAAAEQIHGTIDTLAGRMRDSLKGSEELLNDARNTATSQSFLLRKALLESTPDPAKIAEYGAATVTAVNQIFDALSAKLNALQGAIVSLDALINGISGRVRTALGETSDEVLSRLRDEFRLNAGSITSAASPDDITRLTGDAITAASDALSILIDRLATLKTLFADLGSLAAQFGSSGADAKESTWKSANPVLAYQYDAIDFQTQVADAMKLSGQAQIDAIAKVKDAAVELYARQKAMLESISADALEMHQSIQKQIWDIALNEMKPQEQATTVMDRINELRGNLASASSPELAKQITGEIQALISQYLNMFSADDPNRGGAVAWATKTLHDVEQIADETYKKMYDSIEASNALIREGLERAGVAVAASLTTTQQEIEEWTKLLKDTRALWDSTQKSITDEIKAWAMFLANLNAPLQSAVDSSAATIMLLIPILESLEVPLRNAIGAAANDIVAYSAALGGLSFPLEAAINAAAGAIAAFVIALPGINNALGAAVNAASNDIGAYAKALSDISFPLEAAINAAAGGINALILALPTILPALDAAIIAAAGDIVQAGRDLASLRIPLQQAIQDAANEIQTFINAMPSLNNALQASINWAAFQIAATANALPTVVPALQAAVNAANAEIGKWAFELSQAMPQIVASIGGVDAEINLWIAALVALRGAIETNLNTEIAATATAFTLLIPEIDAARLLLTTLPDITTSAGNASGALDGLTGAAGRLQDYLDGIGGGGGRQPIVINRGGGNEMSSGQVAAMLRDDPTLTMSQVGF